MFLSILVCTRNRAHELLNCLPPLAEQAKEFPDVEVIIIDNGSSDNTKEVVQNSAASLQYPFRYAYEEIPGLSQARNRGRKEARGEILAYIDDDAIVRSEWLARLRQHFLDNKSDCLGGMVSVEFGGDLPFRYEPSMNWFFMDGILGEEPRFLDYPAHPTGCNMAFKTSVFDAVGGFNTHLLLYGDEKDFFRRVSDKGFTVYYDPRVEVHQFIPEDRLSKKELGIKSYRWGDGSAMNFLIEKGSGVSRLGKIAEYFIRTAYMALRSTNGSFSSFFTLWYNRGYLNRMLKGVETKKGNGG